MYLLEHQTEDTYLQPDGTFDESWITALQMNYETAILKQKELTSRNIPTWLRCTDDMVMV